jgi:hypothetical protein
MPDPGIARAARLRRLAGIVCLALAAAGAAYFLVRGSFSPAPEKQAAAAVPAPRPTSVVQEIPVGLETSAAEPLKEVIVPTPPRVRRTAVPVTRAAPPSRGASSAPDSEDAAAASPPPVPAPPRLGSSRSYAGGVTLPGGEKIELGGIAWSEEEPRALLNDRIVGVGGYVSGYSVSKIETDRVVLEKDGATIVLTVR